MTNIIFVGRMGSGKTTLAHQLVDNYGYTMWPSMTTRPMRPGEVDGIDYMFVNDEQFTSSAAYGYITAVREYQTEQGLWRYGFPIPPDENTVSILDPKGLSEVIDRIPDPYGVFVDTDPDICRYRALARGDDPNEILRRMDRDEDEFNEFAQVFMDFCKLRIGKKRTPEEDAERIIRYVRANK